MKSYLLFTVALFSFLFSSGQSATDVTNFGVKPDSSSDNSAAILKALNSRKPVFFPKGRYRYLSKDVPDLTAQMVLDKDAHIDGPRFKDIFVRDDSGRNIGFQYNYEEDDVRNLGSNRSITSGNILPAPLSERVNKNKVALIAHWYNDFGLERTRAAKGNAGSLTWYYWNWAHTDNPSGYDPSRHPLLGWYKGDDVNVLDWQCYWLREYGVTGVNLSATGINVNKWNQPSNRHYWVYNLFEKTKNFEGLKYVLWGKTSSKSGEKPIFDDWNSLLNNFFKKYNNYFFLETNGKKYPVIYLFEADELRRSLDRRGVDKTRSFLKKIAARFKANGFGGVCVFARHPTNSKALNYKDLENDDVIYIPAGYSDVTGVRNAKTYADYVSGFSAPEEKAIVNVVTSHESKPPHPSRWTQSGSTPQLFQSLLSKAVKTVLTRNNLPKVIQIYNVAEWAEGGPGLQPNVRDRFGYLDAVRKVVADMR